MAFPAAPTESGSAKLHFLSNDGNDDPGVAWFGVTEGVTGVGANNVGFAGIATHVHDDIASVPGGLDTTGTEVPIVLVGAVRDDTLSTLSPIAGDAVYLLVTSKGALWTHDDGLDAVISGSELQVNIVASLPAGANAIGKLAANNGVDIGDVTVNNAAGSGVFVRPGTSSVWDVSDRAARDLGKVDIADALPTGSNTIGEVTIGAASTAAGDLAKAEDAIHVSGDVGLMTLAVRKDAQVALSADGDYIPLIVNSAGALYVTGGGGGTEYVVNDVTPVNPTGATFVMERDDVLSALTEIAGDWTNPRATAEGALWVQDFNSDQMRADLITLAGAVSASKMQVDMITMPSLPAGTNNIGDVDVLTLPPLPAGTNNIGDVDVLTLPANASVDLNQVGGIGVVTGGVAGSQGVGGLAAKGAAVAGDPVLVAGSDGTNVETILVTTAGRQVVMGSAAGNDGSTNSLAFPQVSAALTFKEAVAGHMFNGATWDRVRGTVADGLLVNLGANNDVSISGAVDVSDRAARDLGKVDIAGFDVSLPAGGNNIGDVDVLTLPSLPTGANIIGEVKVTDGTNVAAVLTGDPGGTEKGMVTRIAGGVKDTGWDAGATAVQRGTAIGITAQTAQTLLAADASNLYNVLDAVVTIFAGTAAPAGKAYVSLKHGTTEFKRIYAKIEANETVELAIHFRMPDRGALNQAVTATLSAALGTNGEYTVVVHAYKTSS